MPFPEHRHASPAELKNGRGSEVSKGIESLDSEQWEQKRDVVIKEMCDAFMRGEVDDMDVYECILLMARYSLKDGLAFVREAGAVKELNLNMPAATATLLRFYSKPHEVMGGWDREEPVRDRILDLVDDGFDEFDVLRDRNTHRTENFLKERGFLWTQEPDFESVIKELSRADSDEEGAIGKLELEGKRAPLKARIDALYDPFYRNATRESAARLKIEEESPAFTEASQFLQECARMVREKPIFLAPMQEWVLKELFGVKAYEEDRLVTNPKTGIQEPMKAVIQALEQEAGGSAWEASKFLWDIRYADVHQRTDISRGEMERVLPHLGIDPQRIDVQGVMKHNQLSKLELTTKIQAKMHGEQIRKEIVRFTAELDKAKKKKRVGQNHLNWQQERINLLQSMAHVLDGLARGEMDEDEVNRASGSLIANISDSTYTGRYGLQRRLPSGVKEEQLLSGAVTKVVQKMFEVDPELERESRPARIDHWSQAEVDALFSQLFPNTDLEEVRERARRVGKRDDSWLKAWWQSEQRIPAAQDYFRPEDRSYGADGDPRDEYPVELLTASEPVDAILVTAVYDTREEDRGMWISKQATLPKEQIPDTPCKTVSFHVRASVGMALPLAMHGRITKVVGVTEGYKNVPVVLTHDEMGRTMIDSMPPNVTHIAYTQEVPEVLPAVTDIPTDAYEQWLADKGRDARATQEAYRNLPADCRAFIDRVRLVPPADRVRQIELFSRTVGYYDFKNAETKGERVGKPLRIRWELMRSRMKLLQKQDPGNKELALKKVAGVCVDFQELTTALMLAAGCISGKISALRVHNKDKVTSKDAHALSYVEWPAAAGGTILVAVDGTPGGTDEGEQEDLARIQEVAQAERLTEWENALFEQEMEMATKTTTILDAQEVARSARGAKTRYTKRQDTPKKQETQIAQYLRTELAPEETRGLYRALAWLAYSGILTQYVRSGGSRETEGWIKMDVNKEYTKGAQEPPGTSRVDEVGAIEESWKKCWHEVQPLLKTSDRLLAILKDALPNAGRADSKRDKALQYLSKLTT